MKRFLSIVVGLLLLFVGARLVIPYPWFVRETAELRVLDRPECPRHEGVYVDSSGKWVPNLATIAGSGPITTVPEFHDCQRLIDPQANQEDGRKFGPLVAVFARIHLENLSDPPGFIPLAIASSQVGTSAVAFLPTFSAVIPSGANMKTGSEQSVATILNYDDMYAPLQIPAGYSCLYLYHTGATWAARLVQAPTDAACLNPLDPNQAGVDLKVVPTPDPNPAPVARWDWDPINKEHFLGIRCGSSWCEVYNPNTVTHHSVPSTGGWSKGWVDEQYLAEATTTTGNPDKLKPGIASGKVEPIGFLDLNTEAMYDTWQPVARVTLSSASETYKKKLKYAQGGGTIVSLCKGTRMHCVGALQIVLDPPNKCDNDADPWWAKIVSFEGTRYRCVIRRTMSPTDDTPLPPGVVRWRWKLKDEGMWMRCPGGCCEKS